MPDEAKDPLEGYCEACHDPWQREQLPRLEVAIEDAWGTLYRCKVCGQHFYYDFMTHGGGRFTPVDRDWIKKTWPDGKERP